MRVLLRSTLIAMLATIAVLTAWSVTHRSNSADTVSAASGLQVPPYCIPPELSAMRQLLSKTSDAGIRQAVQAKEKAAERAALDCAANATSHLPAQKPAHAGPLPTSIPGPTSTLRAGIQHAELLPTGDFLPSQDGSNMWTATVNGHALQVFAGSRSGANDDWQNHPDWVTQPQLHVQGALRVVADNDGLHATEYPTPGRHGELHLVSACGSTLVAQAADGTTFTFDAAAPGYVKNPISCPGPTP